MSKIKIPIPIKKISDFCIRWDVVEFSLFGSILREDFNQDSDVDVLVTFAPNAEISLFDLVKMEIELKEFFGRDVDLVEKASLNNPYRSREILQSAQQIYAA